MSILDKLKKGKDQAENDKKATAKDSGKEKTVAEIKAEKEKQKSTGKKAKAKPAKSDTGLSYKWLSKPVITEKATWLGSEGKYIFEVDKKANKIEIKKAIKDLYDVDVIKANIINLKGKKVNYGRISGKTKNKKKVIVTLAEGQSIELYEGV